MIILNNPNNPLGKVRLGLRSFIVRMLYANCIDLLSRRPPVARPGDIIATRSSVSPSARPCISVYNNFAAMRQKIRAVQTLLVYFSVMFCQLGYLLTKYDDDDGVAVT